MSGRRTTCAAAVGIERPIRVFEQAKRLFHAQDAAHGVVDRRFGEAAGAHERRDMVAIEVVAERDVAAGVQRLDDGVLLIGRVAVS